MPIVFDYKPPAIDASAALKAAGEIGVEAAGKTWLDASQPLVPVDTGEMKASGKAEKEGPLVVAVSYTRTGADGYNVAARQHEDMTLHHDVGQAKFLEQPMHADAPAILTAMAEPIRALFG